MFVGTTALGTREVVATPLDTLFAGVEVQATAADNLLQGDFLSRPEHRVAIETQLVIGFGRAGGAALPALRPGVGPAATIGCGAALWGTSYWMLSAQRHVPLAALPHAGRRRLRWRSMTAAGLLVERRRADKSAQENAASRRLMVQTLLSLTGIRDLETGKHSVRTQSYTRVLAQQLSKHPGFHDYLTPERIELLASLAPLHDIGKVGVPDRVLNKPGELTPDELAEMRKHPAHGRAVIENAERAAGVRDDLTLAIAKDIVYTHHEWWNGTGYPQGLKGAQIPIPGRIMAVVDVYDAIRTRNLYNSADVAGRGRGAHSRREGHALRPRRGRCVRAGLADAAPPVAVTRRALTSRVVGEIRIRPYRMDDAQAVWEAVRESLRGAAALDAVGPPWLLIDETRSWLAAQVQAFQQRTDIRVRDHVGGRRLSGRMRSEPDRRAQSAGQPRVLGSLVGDRAGCRNGRGGAGA